MKKKSEFLQKDSNMTLKRTIPDWYKIGDCIAFRDYIKSLSGVYEVLEKKNKSIVSNEDHFLKNIWISYEDFSEDQYIKRRQFERYNRSLQMKLGNMHRSLIGCFSKYRTLPRKHTSNCDIERVDLSEYWIVTNNSNTLNSKSAKSVGNALQTVIDKGDRAFLVQINCDKKTIPRHGMPREVELLNGKHMYSYLSSRENFYEDLNETLTSTFKNIKSYAELSLLASN